MRLTISFHQKTSRKLPTLGGRGKAALAGIAVHRVDPRNTSRTCPECGHIGRANRKTQSLFVCTSCGFAGLADVIAAENIRVLGGGAVSHPRCSDADGSVAP